jgi:hypothetical protein
MVAASTSPLLPLPLTKKIIPNVTPATRISPYMTIRDIPAPEAKKPPPFFLSSLGGC